MLTRPETCVGCELHDQHIALGWMEPEGSGANSVMAVAEALGENEARDGLPLRPDAPAGGVFDRTLRRAGLPREAFVLTNTIHCRPGPRNLLEHQPYEYGAINHCRQYMDQEVRRFQPKVMLAMGNVPLRTLTGYCGPKRTITYVRGFYLDNLRYPGIPVIGTIHPSAIARDKTNLLGVFRLDIMRAVALAKAGGQFSRPEKHYVKFPDISVCESWLAMARLHPEWPIMYDIETTDSIGGDESELKTLADGSVQISPLKEEFQDAPDEERESPEAIDTRYEANIPKGLTRITQIQFSIVGDGDAIVVAFEGDFIKWTFEVLALPNPKMGWNNYTFDDPLVEAAGARINGDNHDLMWAWHSLQPDLPRGLQYATSFFIPEAEPWKHRASEDAGEYGGDDVAYPRRYGPKLLEDLKTRGIWSSYERHIVRLHPILVAASRRGIPVDDKRRVDLGEKVDLLKAGVDRELQEMFPDHLRKCEPKEGYVREADADRRRVRDSLGDGERWVRRRFKIGGANPELHEFAEGAVVYRSTRNLGLSANDPSPQESGDGINALQSNPTRSGGVDGNAPPSDPCPPGFVERWCRIQPFLPNSPQQILSYIRWRREREIEEKILGYRSNARWANWADRALREMAERNALYKVPRKFREEKDTTEKKELERLGAKTGDRFFSLVVEHREYGKVRATYVNGWQPGPDGRVHTTFSFGPATGQLSSVRPATMTMPKPGGEETQAEARKTMLAKLCRGMVVAPPGYKIICVDKKSFHATTLGFNAQDPLYLRITKKDIHSFVTANFMWMNERVAFLGAGLPSNPESWINRGDAELADLLKIVKGKWKAIRDKKAKPTILGIGLGLGDNKCYEMNKRDEVNPRGFESKAEVTRFKNILKGLFPKIFKFHETTKDLAHRQGFLKTRYGYMRWFFDVYHNVKKGGNWVQEAGRDAEAAIALPVQNDAHGDLKEEMLELETLRYMEKFGFISVIHDELQFCCQDKFVEECLHVVPEVMNRPSKVLIDPVVAPGGLVCEVEAGVGQSWIEVA